ncbi:hypothetical protein B7988_12455 [Fibrobacter sp. UWB1]|uniref:GSCFA domain-containing protein n=1 Tax=Fibrobacter sp. UWB1 TaxID=1964355 RepID=UPI000B5233BA|nr:GSCFA domain-containing protein [Fibrobacter sp. UWB1]OWV25152.1 hypothetical protein B7988_12455 [Fibrobacter sp. UWB1]
MELFTRVDTPKAGFEIDYTSRIAFFGSCFADNISAQFAARKFSVLANPFGTVYNPVSIARQIRAIADGKVFGEKDVFQDARGLQDVSGKQDARGNQDARGPWYSWDAHGSLSGATKEECIGKLNAATAQARDFLRKADAVFITLGTAFVYYLKDSGMPVSNCHRQDPNLFTRRMISVDEATEAIREIATSIRQLNRNTHIVFTVSPLRHMGDGAHNNTLSKATLQLAINKALEEANATYFPSYEIVMDELRDYRFYADDMVHLSKTAEEYIFKQMTETYCDSTTRENMAKVEKFLKMANHRIQDESSPATQQLKKKIASQAAELEKQIPGLSLR